MILDIYSKDGILKLSVTPADSDKVSCGIQEETVLSISFTAFECVSLEVYDYVDLFGTRYILLERYRPKMNARGEWAYSIRMYGPESVAAQTLMVNPTDGADNPQVTLTAPAVEHAALIVANLNRRAGTAQWQVGEVVDTPYIDIDYTGKYASDAISELATAANTEWWFDGFTLNISRCEFGEPIELEYGAMLLSGISRSVADGAKAFTRLFPLGSSRNIDLDKYGYARLQLPNREAYIDSGTEIGIIEHFEENAFASIYPRRVGKVSTVRSEVRKGEGEVDYTVWHFTDLEIPFNPNDYEIIGLVKKVTFLSGELRARVFEVNYDTAKKEFEIITQWPYENGVQLPTPPLIPAAGDEYILWNISMPESYYPAAEQEYLEAVEAYIAENQKDVSVFQAATDYTVVGDDYAEFRPGRRVRIVSGEYFPEVGYRDTRIISVSRSVLIPGSMTLVMSDVLSTGKIQNIENGLSEIRGATTKISTSISTSNESLSRKLNRSEFYDLFEKVNVGTADVPKYAIRAKYGLYTEDFLTGRGRPVSISGGGGGGASALSDLNDVLLSAALAAGDLLQYDGTHWVNIPQSSLKPDLSGYATQEWVESKGYALASSLAAHAGDTSIHVSAVDRAKWDKTASDLSSILGSDSDTIINKWEEVVAFLATYTEADTLANLLSNKADKTVVISAGAGLTGGGNLSANRTLALAASGVTAGTYAKVTVDAYGRVTAGTSLAASDIPTLDITKVSGLQTALAAKLDKSVFDDLFEKVNIGTDAAPKYAIRAKYGLYSNEFLAARGQSASIPGGGGGESYNRLDSWADYSTDKAGYVLSAGLGWDLNTRVSSLASGAAVSVTTTGSGNAITTLSKSGTVITATKGATFLTSHQSLLDYYTKSEVDARDRRLTTYYASRPASANVNFGGNAGLYTFLATSSMTTGKPTSDAHILHMEWDSATSWASQIAVPAGNTNIQWRFQVGSEWKEWRTIIDSNNFTAILDSQYVKKSGDTMSGNLSPNASDEYDLGDSTYRWRSLYATTINVKSTTLIPNLNADLLDGLDASSFGQTLNNVTIDANEYNSLDGLRGGKVLNAKNVPRSYYAFLHFGRGQYYCQLNGWNNELFFRAGGENDATPPWKQVAFLDSNVASAAKLQTARTLWGQYFDGTGNVSGNMIGVGNIAGSGAMIISANGRLTLNTTNAVLDLKIYDDDTRSVVLNGVAFKPYDAATHKLTLGSSSAVWERIYGLYIDTDSGHDLRLCTAGAEHMRITAASGYVGIGTTSPAYKLDVAGTLRASGAATFLSTVNASGAIHSSVGVSSDGYVTARGQNSASDIRLKNHMEDVTFSIDQIADAPLWRFRWRRDGSIDVGSVAQYWRAVMPELTHVLPDAYLGLDYGKAALLASVSLAREHRNLAARVACLERENKQLKKLLKSA